MASYRLVWFQHLHKAAGTYVVSRAMANGVTFWPDHHNGNPVVNGKEHPLWEMSANQLTSFIDECEKKGVTFVACEWGGPDYQTLANDDRVILLTCFRHPIKRFISNYNYDLYRMGTKATSYEEYLTEGPLHSSPEYYTKIFARGKLDLELAKSNLELFDYVIVAEDGMDTLDELGWTKESDTTNATFSNYHRAGMLFLRLRWIRLANYLRKKKFIPSENLKIEEKNKLDLELYRGLLDKIED